MGEARRLSRLQSRASEPAGLAGLGLPRLSHAARAFRSLFPHGAAASPGEQLGFGPSAQGNDFSIETQEWSEQPSGQNAVTKNRSVWPSPQLLRWGYQPVFVWRVTSPSGPSSPGAAWSCSHVHPPRGQAWRPSHSGTADPPPHGNQASGEPQPSTPRLRSRSAQGHLYISFVLFPVKEGLLAAPVPSRGVAVASSARLGALNRPLSPGNSRRPYM